MRKFSSVLFALVLVLSISLVTASPAAAATTRYVDDDYGNAYPGSGTSTDPFHEIQLGVNASSSGDTIYVAAGTYTENVVINKSISLIGAGNTTTTIDGNNAGNPITITASDVTVSDFRITNGSGSGDGVFYPDGGIVIDPDGFILIGDYHIGSALTGITIENNIIDGNAGNGVYVSSAGDGGATDNIVIRNNKIFNNGGTSNYAGISLTHPNYVLRLVGDIAEWRRPKNILLQGNTVYENSNYGIYVSAGKDIVLRSNTVYGNSKYGIQLAASWRRTDIPCEFTTVEDNEIYDNARNGVKLTSWNQYNTFTRNNIHHNGFGYTGSKHHYKYGFLFQDGNDNTIQNNTITGNALGGLYLWGNGDPSYIWYSTTNNTITGNTICDHIVAGGHGIYMPDKSRPDYPLGFPNSGFLNSSINCNNIENNTYGLKNLDTTQAVDALYNWWGDMSGPLHLTEWTYDGLPYGPNHSGMGNDVSDYVLYNPWIGREGFVTGGGTIRSEQGDYAWNPDAEGMANFGFVAQYKKGANVPAGNTNFVFSAGDLHFQSSEYDWLVVAGNTARFKGVGTINGASGIYKFMIWADDDDPDTFRIKIWEEVNVEDVVYDNGGDPLTGGNIFIHKEKKK